MLMQNTRRILAAIYGCVAVLLLLGLVFGKRTPDGRNRIPLPVRMLSSALVLAAALLQWQGGRAAGRPAGVIPFPVASPASHFGAGRSSKLRSAIQHPTSKLQHRIRGLAAVGMGCGFLGDLVMARVIPLRQHILGGMLSFGIGHVLYIEALRCQARHLGLHALRPRRQGLVGGWLTGLIGWWALARNPATPPALNYAALGYALLLSSMSGYAAGLAAQDRRFMPVALGGGLFLLSDLLLASELFRGAFFPQIGDVVWLTYIAGQGLIVAGIAPDGDEVTG